MLPHTRKTGKRGRKRQKIRREFRKKWEDKDEVTPRKVKAKNNK